MPPEKSTTPPAPDIAKDEEAYFRWLIKHDENLALFRVPFEQNIDKFAEVSARHAVNEFKNKCGTPRELFDWMLELSVGYSKAVLPVIGPDGRGYLDMSINGQSAVASIITRIECARHSLLYKHHFKEAMDLSSAINDAMQKN